MFSTTLTCLDAMPRVLSRIVDLWRNGPNEGSSSAKLSADDILDEGQSVHNFESVSPPRKMRISWMAVIAAGALVLLGFFIQDMKQMVGLATSFSFLTAPILAVLGIWIVKKQLPKGFWPQWKYGIAYLGVLFLVVLSIYYVNLTLI